MGSDLDHAGEADEGEGHDADDDEGDAGAGEALGEGGFVDLLADAADEGDGQEPAEAAAEAEGERLQKAVRLVEHEKLHDPSTFHFEEDILCFQYPCWLHQANLC